MMTAYEASESAMTALVFELMALPAAAQSAIRDAAVILLAMAHQASHCMRRATPASIAVAAEVLEVAQRHVPAGSEFDAVRPLVAGVAVCVNGALAQARRAGAVAARRSSLRLVKG